LCITFIFIAENSNDARVNLFSLERYQFFNFPVDCLTLYSPFFIRDNIL